MMAFLINTPTKTQLSVYTTDYGKLVANPLLNSVNW